VEVTAKGVEGGGEDVEMVLKLVPVGEWRGGLLASVFRSRGWMEGQRLGKVPGWELMG
jgi:hypothetical protein